MLATLKKLRKKAYCLLLQYCYNGSVYHSYKTYFLIFFNNWQGLERGARMQLDVLEQRMKAQEAGMNRAKANWAKEMGRLKSVIKEKDIMIEQLQKEKTLVAFFGYLFIFVFKYLHIFFIQIYN